MRNIILILTITSMLFSCNKAPQPNNTNQHEIDSLKTEIELLKTLLNNYQNNTPDTVLATEKPFLEGVPQAPPFQRIKLTISKKLAEGCAKADNPLIGYIISVNKPDGNLESFILQNEEGVQEQIYIDTSEMSQADLSWLPHIFIPGNKIKTIVQRCGSGGFPSVLYVESLRR